MKSSPPICPWNELFAGYMFLQKFTEENDCAVALTVSVRIVERLEVVEIDVTNMPVRYRRAG